MFHALVKIYVHWDEKKGHQHTWVLNNKKNVYIPHKKVVG